MNKHTKNHANIPAKISKNHSNCTDKCTKNHPNILVKPLKILQTQGC